MHDEIVKCLNKKLILETWKRLRLDKDKHPILCGNSESLKKILNWFHFADINLPEKVVCHTRFKPDFPQIKVQNCHDILKNEKVTIKKYSFVFLSDDTELKNLKENLHLKNADVTDVSDSMSLAPDYLRPLKSYKDNPGKKALIYLSVGRTGSSTFRSILSNNFSENYYHIEGLRHLIDFKETYNKGIKEKSIALGLAFPEWDIYKWMEDRECYFITTLREPLKRFFSMVNQNENFLLEPFGLDYYIKENKNPFIKFYGRNSLLLAKEKLDYVLDSFGFIESFDETFSLFAEKYKLKKLTYIYWAQSIKSYSYENDFEKINDEFLKANEEDAEFYKHAISRYKDFISKSGIAIKKGIKSSKLHKASDADRIRSDKGSIKERIKRCKNSNYNNTYKHRYLSELYLEAGDPDTSFEYYKKYIFKHLQLNISHKIFTSGKVNNLKYIEFAFEVLDKCLVLKNKDPESRVNVFRRYFYDTIIEALENIIAEDHNEKTFSDTYKLILTHYYKIIDFNSSSEDGDGGLFREKFNPFMALFIKRKLISEWKKLAGEKIAVFGLGRHSLWLEKTVSKLKNGPVLKAVFDDNAPDNASLLGIPVINTKKCKISKPTFNAVLISTDNPKLKKIFKKNIHQLFGKRFKTIYLYDKFPPGPYPNKH